MLHITVWAQYYHLCIQMANCICLTYTLKECTTRERGTFSNIRNKTISYICMVGNLLFIQTTNHSQRYWDQNMELIIPSLAAARLQRWALILAAYDYISQQMITGMQTDYHDYQWMQKIEKGKNNIKHKANTTVVAAVVKRETQLDIVLSRVLRYTREGWPKVKKVTKELKPYFNRHDNCLLWGINCQKIKNYIILTLG